MQGRRSVGRLLAVITAVALVGFGPAAGAIDPPDPTGDILPPLLQSLSMSPTSADVTDADAVITLTLRVTDDKSGALDPDVSWMSEVDHSAHGFELTRLTGDALDSQWRATALIRRGTKPARYPVWVALRDR